MNSWYRTWIGLKSIEHQAFIKMVEETVAGGRSFIGTYKIYWEIIEEKDGNHTVVERSEDPYRIFDLYAVWLVEQEIRFGKEKRSMFRSNINANGVVLGRDRIHDVNIKRALEEREG